MNTYRAIVLGATGAVGQNLVRELLGSPRCAGVTILTRRHSGLFDRVDGVGDGVDGVDGGPAKLSQRVVSMDDLESATAAAAQGCQVAFCTLGVGQPRKVSRDEHWKVDVEYARDFARGCQAAGVRHLSLLGSVGADSQSKNRYLRVKGCAEEAVRDAGLARVSWFRPSLLVTDEIRYGLQDRVTQFVFPLLSWMLPRRFHQIRVGDLGRAMRINAEQPAGEPVEVLYYPDFVARLGLEPRGGEDR